MLHGRPEPIWELDVRRELPAHRAPLRRDVDVDAVVIGAGVTGATTALLLAQQGRQVVLLDAADIASGATSNTSGHLTRVPDGSLSALVDKFGMETASLVLEGCGVAIDLVEHLAQENAIECGLSRVPGFLFTESLDGIDALEGEAQLANVLGLPAILTDVVPLPFAVAAVLFPGQAQLNAVRYVLGLADALERLGGRVACRTRVLEVEHGEPCVVHTEHGSITADDVVIATHSPFGVHLIHTELAAYRSYMLAARTVDDVLTSVPAIYWDDASPYNYLSSVPTRVGPMLLVGGQDHRTGQEHDTPSRFEKLEAWTRERVEVERIERRWSSEVFQSADELPYVGAGSHPELTFATGFAGNGLAFGTLSAIVLSNLIAGIDDPWQLPLSPRRIKPFAAAREFVRDNLNVTMHFVSDRLRKPEADTIDDVAPGEGKLVAVGGRKLAVYREPSGELHALSPICSHLKCIVQWNGAQRTWDCPCHGGIYSATGEVLAGPPTRALERVELLAPDSEVVSLVVGPEIKTSRG